MKNSYQLLDFGNLQRLELWADKKIIRPDKSAIGQPKQPELWQSPDFIFLPFSAGNHQGKWQGKNLSQIDWQVRFNQWRFSVRLGSTKQLGFFPEQLPIWKLLSEIIAEAKSQSSAEISLLNGFAYTGAASIISSLAGAKVTHVDSNANAINQARINQKLNQAPNTIRWIKEDVISFMQREARREHQYDIIILDPPAFGHGSKGERFSIHKNLLDLIKLSGKLFSRDPLILALSLYSGNQEFSKIKNNLKIELPYFNFYSVPLVLFAKSGKILSTGTTILGFNKSLQSNTKFLSKLKTINKVGI